MLLLKRFQKQEVHRRYRVYRAAFALYSAVFFVCFLIGIVFATAIALTADGVDASYNFALHWSSRVQGGFWGFALYGFGALLPYFFAFVIFGITVYGPLVSLISAALCAFNAGSYVRALIGHLYLYRAPFPVAYYVLGLLPIAFAVLVCASFSTAAALRIFTPKRKDSAERAQVFGGTLFCAPYFEGTLNLRFLGGYSLCFFGLLVLLFAFCIAQSAMVLML